jgi:hypothetical protein
MLIAVLVLLGLGVSAAGMSQLTEVKLTQAVNRNWRGAYDILVTARSNRATEEAAKTSGLIEPDFLAYAGHGGISFPQLDAIRAISGVEVAAPVTTIGYVAADASAPTVYVARSSLPRKPTLYRLSLSVTTSDGVHRFTIARQTSEVLLGPSSKDVLSGSGSFSDSQGVSFALDAVAPQVTPVVAVDPTAERRMFGPSFAFLKALSIKSSLLRLESFRQSRIPPQFSGAAADLGSFKADAQRGGTAVEADGGAYLSEPVVPIMVSDHLSYPLGLRLTVDQIGHPLASYPRSEPVTEEFASAAQEAGKGVTRAGTSSENLSRKLRAFEPASLAIRWPGSAPEQGQGSGGSATSRLDTQLARRASYGRKRRTGQGLPAFRIKPLGLVGWNGEPTGATGGEPVVVGQNAQGVTQSYRGFSTVPFSIKSKFHATKGVASAPPQAFFLAPVGSFDSGKLRLPTNPLNHVPLGAWEPASARLLPKKGGQPGQLLEPTENPLGFLTSPPEVIANIDQASLLRGPDPIDAIRVRVAGLKGFDAASRAKVERIASRIAQLGLDVRIVAGSSPRPVDVYVPKYLPGGRDLGWVQEEWTSLGAAQAASSALSGAEKALLFLSLGLALLLAVTVSSVGVESGARDVRVWRSLGWSRGRMLWWLVSDATLGGVLVAAAAVAAVVAGGRLGLLWLGFGLGGSLVGVQLLFALLLLRRQLSGPSRAGRRRQLVRRGGSMGTGVLSVARRAVVRQARISVLIAVGITLSTVVVVLGVAGLRSASSSAHTSLLGAYLNTTLLAFHAVSLALLVIGGLAAAAIATRAWQRRRTGEIAAFAALGWQRKRVLAQLRLERVLLGVLAALLTLALAAALHATGVAIGGLLALPIILVLCGAYILVGELPTRRLVQSRWPT